jgi:hypothetical protein
VSPIEKAKNKANKKEKISKGLLNKDLKRVENFTLIKMYKLKLSINKFSNPESSITAFHVSQM